MSSLRAAAPLRAVVLAAALLGAGAAMAAEPPAKPVALPGISYVVLASGPAEGAHPTRADTVTMRYIGRLADGEVFSTSPSEGTQVSTFPVGQLIPGMTAALQLMRPGDLWRITMPPYLAYGPGRPLAPASAAPPTGPAAQVVQKRGIPANATLIFDVELVSILPPKTP